MFQKMWEQHVIADLGDGAFLLHVDRHILHDIGGPRAMLDLESRGLRIREPGLTVATVDHGVSTTPGRADTSAVAVGLLKILRRQTGEFGIKLFDVGQPGSGIVHVIGPELGLSLPGSLVVCGDSHTCTHGGVGAFAFGIGHTELVHVLATQTVLQRRPKTMRVRFEGKAAADTSPKDLILKLIRQIGVAGGTGYAIEYTGDAIRDMSIEGRMTVCNLSIELGAKIGFVAPDEKTYEYLAGRRYSPSGKDWDQAVAAWKTLPSDPDAVFDEEVVVDVNSIAPQITWGTTPEQVVDVDGIIPDPALESDPSRRRAMSQALEYMGLTAGQPIAGTKVDWVFIGSCTNSRLSDLRDAAAAVRGRKVAPGVRAWIVPGSESIKLDAEAESLDRIFIDAGFEWRESGCSMCLAANGETIPPGSRSVSTSNRNFVGRQGPNSRTHLASPITAVAAAIAGVIADPRGR